jgi:hypothetical protein
MPLRAETEATCATSTSRIARKGSSQARCTVCPAAAYLARSEAATISKTVSAQRRWNISSGASAGSCSNRRAAASRSTVIGGEPRSFTPRLARSVSWASTQSRIRSEPASASRGGSGPSQRSKQASVAVTALFGPRPARRHQA